MSTIKSEVKRSRALGFALPPKAVKHMERRPYPPGQHGFKSSAVEYYAK